MSKEIKKGQGGTGQCLAQNQGKNQSYYVCSR